MCIRDRLCMLGVTPDAKEELEKAIPGGFFYIPERNYFDYIYLREDLATLKEMCIRDRYGPDRVYRSDHQPVHPYGTCPGRSPQQPYGTEAGDVCDRRGQRPASRI